MTYPADPRTSGTITLTRWVWSNGTQDVTGPFVVGQLPPQDAARIDEQLRSSNFFSLPSQVTPQTAADSYTTIRVEWDGGYHDVSFSGRPGYPLDQLDSELNRLRGGGGGAAAAGAYGAGDYAGAGANGYPGAGANGYPGAGANGYSAAGANGYPGAGATTYSAAGGYDAGAGGASGYGGASAYLGTGGYGGAGGTGYPGSPTPARSSGGNRIWLIGGAAALAVLVIIGVVAVVLTRGGDDSKGKGSGTTTTVALGPAAGLTTSPGAGTVRLTWQPGPGADHYVVTRDGSVVGSNVHETTYLDELSDVAEHSYSVTAVDSTGKQSTPTAPVSATAETRRLSAAEQTLVDRLPSGLVDTSSCTEAIDGESKYLIDTKTGLKAAVNCTPQTAGSAPQPDGKMTILQYTSATTYNSAVSDLKSGKTQGTCASTTPHQTTWSFTNADGSSGKSVGALACGFYSDSQYAWLSWTYDKDWVTMTVYGPTGGSSADIPNLDKFFLAAPVELSP